MERFRILRLHWKLFFPLIILLWLIVGIMVVYTVVHERARNREWLEQRLTDVNETVLAAYDAGEDIQKIVDFVYISTDNTALDGLRLSVYDSNDSLIADNSARTIRLHDANGNVITELRELTSPEINVVEREAETDGQLSMYHALCSDDGAVRTYAALPIDSHVKGFMAADPMVWLLLLAMVMLTTLVAHLGVRQVCRNVYSLRDFAEAMAVGDPIEIDSLSFSRDELGDVGRHIATLYTSKINAIRDKARSEAQMTSNINHELKTPVGIIRGYLETIVNDPTLSPEQQQAFIRRAYDNAVRLTALIKDVSTISQFNADPNSIQVEDVRLAALLEQVTEDVRAGHIADNMSISWQLDGDPAVRVNADLLTNVFLNLVRNAAKYSGGTEIRISQATAEPVNGLYTFVFSDNGRGIAEEHLPRLFEAFYRCDLGRARRQGGTGLGLTIVHKSITALGGTIQAHNAHPHGLEFTFTLRAADI